MKEYFEKAIQRIRSLKEIVSEKEWNDIAREENLLSSESIKYISQRDFNTLQKEVRASQAGSFYVCYFDFNNDSDRMETYYRGENEPMPYNTNGTLKVREFRGSSNSSTLWTTKRTMQSWNSQRYIYGGPIPVGFAFKRPWEGGHGTQSHD